MQLVVIEDLITPEGNSRAADCEAVIRWYVYIDPPDCPYKARWLSNGRPVCGYHTGPETEFRQALGGSNVVPMRRKTG